MHHVALQLRVLYVHDTSLIQSFLGYNHILKYSCLLLLLLVLFRKSINVSSTYCGLVVSAKTNL